MYELQKLLCAKVQHFFKKAKQKLTKMHKKWFFT